MNTAQKKSTLSSYQHEGELSEINRKLDVIMKHLGIGEQGERSEIRNVVKNQLNKTRNKRTKGECQ